MVGRKRIKDNNNKNSYLFCTLFLYFYTYLLFSSFICCNSLLLLAAICRHIFAENLDLNRCNFACLGLFLEQYYAVICRLQTFHLCSRSLEETCAFSLIFFQIIGSHIFLSKNYVWIEWNSFEIACKLFKQPQQFLFEFYFNYQIVICSILRKPFFIEKVWQKIPENPFEWKFEISATIPRRSTQNRLSKSKFF